MFEQHEDRPRRVAAPCMVVMGLLAGCAGEGGAAPNLDGAVVANDPGTEKACEPGSVGSCTCPDGSESGAQGCSSEGTLLICQCEGADAAPVVKPSAPAQLCPEIAGSADCRAESFGSSKVPVSLLFVIDRSRSMACNPPPLQSSAECEARATALDDAVPSKWDVTVDALGEAFAELPGTNTQAGLSFFSVNGACGVDSTPAVPLASISAAQLAAMDTALANTNPRGQTPIVGAAILAYAHLHQEAMAPGNRFVVLMTDGAESCDVDAVPRLLDVEVQKARDANIRTFVIGAPGSEGARALLSELAYRGGTARAPDCQHDIDGEPGVGDCHFDMTRTEDFAAALAEALGTVESVATSCEYSVPSDASTNDVNVQYTGADGAPQCFPRDDSKPCDGGANGWQYAKNADGSDDTSRVVLCGDACRAVEADPAARIDILVGCDPLVVILI